MWCERNGTSHHRSKGRITKIGFGKRGFVIPNSSFSHRRSSSRSKAHLYDTLNRLREVQEADLKSKSSRTTASRKAIDCFSLPSFRDGQREAIEEIQEALDKGYKYVLLDAPTGLGKSRVAQAFAKAFASSHVVTPQKILQMQYKRDFAKDMFIMMARGAYTCIEDT